MEEEYYEYVDEVNPNLICAICQTPFINPVTTSSCKHTFCKKCITLSLKHKSLCPIDRSQIDASTLHDAGPIVKNMLEELQVICTHRGCDYKGQRGMLISHKNVCAKKVIPCRNDGCARRIPRDGLAQHQASECEERRMRCETCNALVSHKLASTHPHTTTTSLACGCPGNDHAESHRWSCPEAEIPCDHAHMGCPASIKRSDLATHLGNCLFEQLSPYLRSLQDEIKGLEQKQLKAKSFNEAMCQQMARYEARLATVTAPIPDSEIRREEMIQLRQRIRAAERRTRTTSTADRPSGTNGTRGTRPAVITPPATQSTSRAARADLEAYGTWSSQQRQQRQSARPTLANVEAETSESEVHGTTSRHGPDSTLEGDLSERRESMRRVRARMRADDDAAWIAWAEQTPVEDNTAESMNSDQLLAERIGVAQQRRANVVRVGNPPRRRSAASRREAEAARQADASAAMATGRAEARAERDEGEATTGDLESPEMRRRRSLASPTASMVHDPSRAQRRHSQQFRLSQASLDTSSIPISESASLSDATRTNTPSSAIEGSSFVSDSGYTEGGSIGAGDGYSNSDNVNATGGSGGDPLANWEENSFVESDLHEAGGDPPAVHQASATLDAPDVLSFDAVVRAVGHLLVTTERLERTQQAHALSGDLRLQEEVAELRGMVNVMRPHVLGGIPHISAPTTPRLPSFHSALSNPYTGSDSATDSSTQDSHHDDHGQISPRDTIAFSPQHVDPDGDAPSETSSILSLITANHPRRRNRWGNGLGQPMGIPPELGNGTPAVRVVVHRPIEHVAPRNVSNSRPRASVFDRLMYRAPRSSRGSGP